MIKLLHFLKYRYNPVYRRAWDNKVRFTKIMATNRSILEERN
jgi:hypothetical protein